MSIKDLRPMVEAAATRQAALAASLCGDSNPQVIASRNEHLGALRAYLAVIEALDAPRPTAAFSLRGDGRGLAA